MITRYFPYIPGGVSDYTYYLSGHLAKKGLDVSVLTSDDKRIINNLDDVKVMPLIKKWDLKGVKEIIEYVKEISPNWIIIQYVPYMYSYYGIPFWLIFLYLNLKKQKFKICTTFHEVAILLDTGDFKHLPIAISQRIIAYFLALLSDKIVVPIERWKKMLHFFKNKIKVIPVGSNIVPENEEGEAFEESHKKDFIIIGSFGSAQKSRRIDVHLKAVKILKDKGLKVKYIFVGETPAYLKKMAKNLKIPAEFTGYLPKEKAYKILKTFDFFIFFDKYSNKYEGGINLKSGSVSATFSAGVPVISNRGFFTDETFKGYYIYSDPSPEEIFEKIIGYLKDEKYRNLKNKIIEFYNQRIKWKKIVWEYEKFLELRKSTFCKL